MKTVITRRDFMKKSAYAVLVQPWVFRHLDLKPKK